MSEKTVNDVLADELSVDTLRAKEKLIIGKADNQHSTTNPTWIIEDELGVFGTHGLNFKNTSSANLMVNGNKLATIADVEGMIGSGRSASVATSSNNTLTLDALNVNGTVSANNVETNSFRANEAIVAGTLKSRFLIPQSKLINGIGDADNRFGIAWVNFIDFNGHRLTANEDGELTIDGKKVVTYDAVFNIARQAIEDYTKEQLNK